MAIKPLHTLNPLRFDTPTILKRLAGASRQLAELKGVAASIPNEGILINTLGLQEAKESSAVENIVTTDDELYQHSLFPDDPGNPAAKEVLRYREALWAGFRAVGTHGLITLNDIRAVQATLEENSAGFRKLPETPSGIQRAGSSTRLRRMQERSSP